MSDDPELDTASPLQTAATFFLNDAIQRFEATASFFGAPNEDTMEAIAIACENCAEGLRRFLNERSGTA